MDQTKTRRTSQGLRGTLRTLPSGRIQARVASPNGTRVTLGTFPTTAAANDAIGAYHSDRSRGLWVPTAQQPSTLLDLFDHYCATHETTSGGVERSRARFRASVLTGQSRTAIERNRTPIGDYRADRCSMAVLREWVRALEDEGVAASTIASWWGFVRNALDVAVERHEIGKNPARGASPMRHGALAESRPDPFIFTLPEIVRLTEAAPAAYRLMFETLFWSGMRGGELRAVHGHNLLVARNKISVAASVSAGVDRVPYLRAPKTKSSRRLVPVPPDLMGRLVEHSMHPQVPLFPSARGGLLDERRLSELWVQTRQAAGVLADPDHGDLGRERDPKPHDARKTVVSLLFALGADLPRVMAWVGHTAATVTLDTYAAVSDDLDSDPVMIEVRDQKVSIVEKWAMLHSLAYATYATASPASGGPGAHPVLQQVPREVSQQDDDSPAPRHLRVVPDQPTTTQIGA